MSVALKTCTTASDAATRMVNPSVAPAARSNAWSRPRVRDAMNAAAAAPTAASRTGPPSTRARAPVPSVGWLPSAVATVRRPASRVTGKPIATVKALTVVTLRSVGVQDEGPCDHEGRRHPRRDQRRPDTVISAGATNGATALNAAMRTGPIRTAAGAPADSEEGRLTSIWTANADERECCQHARGPAGTRVPPTSRRTVTGRRRRGCPVARKPAATETATTTRATTVWSNAVTVGRTPSRPLACRNCASTNAGAGSGHSRSDERARGADDRELTGHHARTALGVTPAIRQRA